MLTKFFIREDFVVVPVIAVQAGPPVFRLDAGLNQETCANWLRPSHRHRAFNMHVQRVALPRNWPGAKAAARMCSGSQIGLDDDFPVVGHGIFIPYLTFGAHASSLAVLAALRGSIQASYGMDIHNLNIPKNSTASSIPSMVFSGW